MRLSRRRKARKTKILTIESHRELCGCKERRVAGEQRDFLRYESEKGIPLSQSERIYRCMSCVYSLNARTKAEHAGKSEARSKRKRGGD